MKRDRDEIPTGGMDGRLVPMTMDLGQDVDRDDVPVLKAIWQYMNTVAASTSPWPPEYSSEGVDFRWHGRVQRHRTDHSNYYAVRFDFAPNVVITDTHMDSIRAIGVLYVKGVGYRMELKASPRMLLTATVHSHALPPPQPLPMYVMCAVSPFAGEPRANRRQRAPMATPPATPPGLLQRAWSLLPTTAETPDEDSVDY